MSKPNEVYRIIKTMQVNASSTSTGNVTLYTDEASVLRDLLPAQMRMERYRSRPKNMVMLTLLDFWREVIGDSPDMYPYPLSIRLERHITDHMTGEGRWLAVAWSFEPPKVTINGEAVE